MPLLRKHPLLEFQGGGATHRGKAPGTARGPGNQPAPGLCLSHMVGLSVLAPGVRPGTETVLNKNLLRKRRGTGAVCR